MRRGNPDNLYYNSEGYPDPTAYSAFRSNGVDEKYKSVAKKWLRQYLDMEKELKTLSDEIAALEGERDSISVKMDGMPRGTDISDKTGNLASRLADLLVNMIDKRAEATEKRNEIVRYIMGLNNRTWSRILYLHFIKGATFERIAVDIDKSWRHTHRLYADALIYVGKDLARR